MRHIKPRILLVPALGLTLAALLMGFSDSRADVDPAAATAYNEGLELINQAKYDEALAKLQEALAVEPDYAAAHFAMGYAMELKGMIAEARAEYAKTIEVDPHFAKAHYRSASLDLQEGDTAAAIGGFRTAVLEDSLMVGAYVGLGIAYSLEEQWGEAQKSLAKAVELDPENPDARYRLATATYHLATAGGEANFDEAARQYKEFLALDPEHPNAGAAYYYLGLIHMRDESYEAALSDFDSYTELNPTAAEGFYRRGKTLEKLGRRPEAIKALKKATSLRESYGAAYYALARLYQELRRDEDALAAYRAAARDASFSQAGRARQMAESMEDYLRKKAEAERQASEEDTEYSD